MAEEFNKPQEMLFPLLLWPVLDHRREDVKNQAQAFLGKFWYATLPIHPAMLVIQDMLPFLSVISAA